jgi:hypothetical protein
MQEHGVPQSTKTTEGLSCGWLNTVLESENFVGSCSCSCGRVFDVIVMNRPDETSSGLYRRAIDSGLFESGRPILLVECNPVLTGAITGLTLVGKALVLHFSNKLIGLSVREYPQIASAIDPACCPLPPINAVIGTYLFEDHGNIGESVQNGLCSSAL